MKTKLSSMIMAAALAVAALSSCSGQKEPSALIAQSERLNGELETLAGESPMFLRAASAEYADGNLAVDIEFADTCVSVSDYSDALVQFVLAQYMKEHLGADLDETVNTIAKEKGELTIKLSDTGGNIRKYAITAQRLKQLVTLKPMQLNYNDVKANVTELLEKRCEAYQQQYKAADAEFKIANNFAQYTLTFDKPTAYASLNQASLTGRYLKIVQAQYEDYGACRPMVENTLQALSIEGYRFVYTDKNETKTLSAAIPWRLIDK